MALIRPEAELMRKYGLTDEELEQEFSEEHIQEITKFSWKEVGPRLQGIRYDPDVIDINRDGYDQEDKRQRLLRMWKTRNGSYATYGALIRAMLKARKKDEAESICKLLRPPPEGKMTCLCLSTIFQAVRLKIVLTTTNAAKIALT